MPRQPERKSPTLKQMTRGAYVYLAALPSRGFAWRDDLKPFLGVIPEGLSPLAYEGPWLIGPFREGLAQPEVGPLNPGKGHPGIHREIASLWSCDSILEFADTYGHLIPLHEMALLEEAPMSSGKQFSEYLYISGESLTQWHLEIGTLRRLLHFWDLVQAEDTTTLARFVVWDSERAVSVKWRDTPEGPVPYLKGERSAYRGKPVFLTEPIVEHGRNAHLLERWEQFAVVEPMRYYISEEVNKQLRAVSPHVLPYAPPSHRIAFIPDSLRAAAYVVFALELAGETQTAICRNNKCPKPGGRFTQLTSRQEFCSDYCRKAEYDRNRARNASKQERKKGEAQ